MKGPEFPRIYLIQNLEACTKFISTRFLPTEKQAVPKLGDKELELDISINKIDYFICLQCPGAIIIHHCKNKSVSTYITSRIANQYSYHQHVCNFYTKYRDLGSRDSQTSFIRTTWYPLKCVRIVKHHITESYRK